MDLAAGLAALYHEVLVPFDTRGDRFHQRATVRGAIAGVDVDVPGVEAERAMVAVAPTGLPRLNDIGIDGAVNAQGQATYYIQVGEAF